MHDIIQPANENLESSSFLILDLLQNSPTADSEGFRGKTEAYLEPCQEYTFLRKWSAGLFLQHHSIIDACQGFE